MITWTEPAGSYFLVGDNRDNSIDSRFVGAVPEDAIVGRVLVLASATVAGRIEVAPGSVDTQTLGRVQMPKKHRVPCPPEFRRRLIEMVRAHA
jgi:hypothetical protein